MGASFWTYYVPYQENIEQALHDLQQRVFEAGEYHEEWRRLEAPAFRKARAIELGILPGEARRPTPPQTIEELVCRCGLEGTHSILDMRRVAANPNYYAAVPLPEEIIERLSTRPKAEREIVEAVARQQELWARLCTFIELNSTQPGRQGWLPDAVVAFFTVERSLEEVIEALLEQEEIWNHVRLWLKMLMDQMVQPAVYGTVLPWSKAACVRYFGGEKPTRADVERAFEQGEIRGMMKKWTGYYSVIYEHDVPYEIVFAGFSGD